MKATTWLWIEKSDIGKKNWFESLTTQAPSAEILVPLIFIGWRGSPPPPCQHATGRYPCFKSLHTASRKRTPVFDCVREGLVLLHIFPYVSQLPHGAVVSEPHAGGVMQDGPAVEVLHGGWEAEGGQDLVDSAFVSVHAPFRCFKQSFCSFRPGLQVNEALSYLHLVH